MCTIVGVDEVENNRIMVTADVDDDFQILYCERNILSRKCSNDDVSAINELLPFMLQCIIEGNEIVRRDEPSSNMESECPNVNAAFNNQNKKESICSNTDSEEFDNEELM